MIENYKFSFTNNRSERAYQVEHLVPALQDANKRRELLMKIDVNNGEKISITESDQSKIMHFVWVLRDAFYYERDLAFATKEWSSLISRWHNILILPDWASNPIWWRHPNAEYKHKGDPEYVVHPCQQAVGWTKGAINKRVERISHSTLTQNDIGILTKTREVMNTECDCLIQTPQRFIVVECKYKTSFTKEQQARQKRLRECLGRLLNRPYIYVEIANHPRTKRRHDQYWDWEMVPVEAEQ